MSTSTEIHQQTPSSDDHTITIKTTYEYAETDERIRKAAAIFNNWEYVRELFEERPELKTKPVNEQLETPLMIAVGLNSHEFVKQLLNNVETHDRDKWCGVNTIGNNALHYAALFGNIIDAKLMVRCLPRTMKWITNIDGDTPYLLAARLGRMEMINMLFTGVTLDENLVVPAIQAGEIDFALEIINIFAGQKIKIPNAVENALEALAAKPDLFSSGNKLGLSGGLIYPWVNICLGYMCHLPGVLTLKSKIPTGLRRICRLTVHIISVLLLPFTYVKTWLQQIQEIKRKDLPSHNLVLQLCDMIEKNPKDAKKCFEPAIATAVKYGNVELIKECILAYPSIIWYKFDGYNLFHLAIKERQVQVYNLVYQMSGHKAFVASELHGEDNALHIAAKLAPPHRLKTITGAALKMQHELKWYKEVESFVEPEHVKALNIDGKTPWMVFTDAHQDLLKEGQQWMKDSSTSCTVVAALIVRGVQKI